MSISVKHDGNATAAAYASAAGGQGKRAQQDAAQMASVMQSAANAANQQLRGATAPSAAPGRSSAQLLHAAAPVGSGGGGGGGRGGSANAYDEADAKMRLLERDYALRGEMYDKAHAGEMEKQNLLGKQSIDEIRMRGSEERGTDVWRQQNNVFAQGQVPDLSTTDGGMSGAVRIVPSEQPAVGPVAKNNVVQTDSLGGSSVEQFYDDYIRNTLFGLLNPIVNDGVGSQYGVGNGVDVASGNALAEQYRKALATAQEAINNRTRGVPQKIPASPVGPLKTAAVSAANENAGSNPLPKLPNGTIDYARMYANGVVNTTNSIFDIW